MASHDAFVRLTISAGPWSGTVFPVRDGPRIPEPSPNVTFAIPVWKLDMVDVLPGRRSPSSKSPRRTRPTKRWTQSGCRR